MMENDTHAMLRDAGAWHPLVRDSSSRCST